MRLPAASPPRQPTVDEVDFKSLYRKSEYQVETADGWELNLTRYQPVAQLFEQPIFNEPLLLVHGFSQNRHAWTCGQFVKNLLYFGADIHILELRGHGKSSIRRQQRRHLESGKPLPPDLDFDWDLDSYLLYDVPAAVQGVKRVTGRSRIFYCGHSMGGILGYGYAGMHDDLEGLVTIGSPADLGSDFFLIKLAAHAEALITAPVDAAFALANLRGRATAAATRAARAALGAVRARSLAERLPRAREHRPSRFSYIPMDQFLRLYERALSTERGYAAYERLSALSSYLILLSNPARVTSDDIRWLLREGGEKEPRKVISQFARWIRHNEMKCYRTGYDFRAGFERIRIPMAIIFGDVDKLASIKSTQRVYRAAKSDYLLWRPVKGNSHLELTMGHDIRQICYDVKNLIAYAAQHRHHGPSLPRREE